MTKTLVRLVGALLSFACVAFIVWRFAQAGVWQHVVNSRQAWHLLLFSMVGAFVYLTGLCALGVAWWSGQSAFMVTRPPLRPFFAIYAVSQFAKYLPGNIGQYVGRHVLLRRYGIGHAALLMGTITEAGFLVLAALVWASNNLSVLWPHLMFQVSAWQVLATECVVVTAAVFAFQHWRQRSSRLSTLVPLQAPGRLLGVLPLQLLLFAAMAGALMLPAQALSASSVMPLLPGVAATSWIAGFLVIGAPAGIGVREAVFIALLHGKMAESDILLLAAAFRIATFVGDALFFLFGFLLGGGRSAGSLSTFSHASVLR